MPTIYTVLASGLACVSLLIVVAMVRRSSTGSSRRVDLANVSVSREWLMQHESQDR